MPSTAFASFEHRSFRYFWFGGFTTNSARWFQYVALPAVVWGLTGSPGWVGFAGFSQFAAMAIVAPVAGMVADYYSRRRILMVSQSLMGLVAVAMALAWMQGVRSPAAYVALAAASGLAGGLNLPVWQAFVSELVPRELLLNAVTLNSAQFNSSRLVGPMLGGITVAAAGPAVAFWISAAGALVVVFALARVESRQAVSTAGAPSMRLIRNTLAVARYIRARRGLVVAFVTVALIGSVGLPIQMLTVVFAEDVFDRGPGGFGLMLTMLGAGAVVAAPVVASLGGRVPRSQIQRVALVCYGAAVLVLAVAPTFVSYLVPLALIGAAHLGGGELAQHRGAAPGGRGAPHAGDVAVCDGADVVEPSRPACSGPADRAGRTSARLRRLRRSIAGRYGRAPRWGLVAPAGRRGRGVLPRGRPRSPSDHAVTSPATTEKVPARGRITNPRRRLRRCL